MMPVGEPEADEEEVSRRPASFISGVGAKSQALAFERILWRTTRGNSILCTEFVEDKFYFVVFFSARNIEMKIRKLCEAFGLRIFALPPLPELPALRDEVQTRLAELSIIAEKATSALGVSLETIALRVWPIEMRLLESKSIYWELSKFQVDGGRKILTGEFWTPTNRLNEVETIVRATEARNQVSIQTVLNIVTEVDEGDNGQNLNFLCFSFCNPILFLQVTGMGMAEGKEARVPWSSRH